MTQKALYAVLVSLGLIAGGGMTFAHYAAADSSTNTPVIASTGTTAIAPTEESDRAEKIAEQSMTPADIKAKEESEASNKDSGDKNEVSEKSESKDQPEMNDAEEAALTPAQKAAHDKAEGMHEGEKDGNDKETSD